MHKILHVNCEYESEKMYTNDCWYISVYSNEGYSATLQFG